MQTNKSSNLHKFTFPNVTLGNNDKMHSRVPVPASLSMVYRKLICLL